MIPKLYAYGASAMALLACLSGAAWWGHGKGVAAQASRDAAQIDRKNAALLTASASLANAAAALRAVSAQAAANAAEATRNKSRAEQAQATAAKEKEARAADLAAWERKFSSAKKQPDCRAVLEMHLCPAVSE